MKKTFFPVILFGLLLSGCATHKEWTATSGSRSDGIVKLSYEQYELEQAILSEQQALDIATKRCNSWGYSGAEAFGGVTRTCNQFGGLSGCAHYLVTKEFQCTNSSTPNLPVTAPLQAQPVMLGIQYIAINKQLSDTLKMKAARGVYVVAIASGSVAEKSGIQQGDIILRIADKDILALDDVQMTLSKILPNSKVPITVWRNANESVLFAMF